MDYIHLDNLFFKGKHGAYEAERKVEQEFEVSVRLGVNVPQAGQRDMLADTVDYDEVKKKIQGVIEGSSRYLIEKLAEEIAAKLLEDTHITSVEITIKKPEVWESGVPGVTIVRTR